MDVGWLECCLILLWFGKILIDSFERGGFARRRNAKDVKLNDWSKLQHEVDVFVGFDIFLVVRGGELANNRRLKITVGENLYGCCGKPNKCDEAPWLFEDKEKIQFDLLLTQSDIVKNLHHICVSLHDQSLITEALKPFALGQRKVGRHSDVDDLGARVVVLAVAHAT